MGRRRKSRRSGTVAGSGDWGSGGSRSQHVRMFEMSVVLVATLLVATLLTMFAVLLDDCWSGNPSCNKEPPGTSPALNDEADSDRSGSAESDASAATALVQSMSGLTKSVGNMAAALDSLREGIELASVHRRISDLELLMGKWRGAGSPGEECEAKPDCQPCSQEGSGRIAPAAFDTVGPCVRREKVGELAFARASIELQEDQETEISRIVEQIRGELRYVFVVGHADTREFSWENRRLGLRRAETVAKTLRGGAADEVSIRAVSGVDWAPTTDCRASHYGQATVYLLWHGASPLCTAGQPVPLTLVIQRRHLGQPA